MAIFYTSVDRHGNEILFRGYNGINPIKRKIKYKPTLYVPSPDPTEFKTITGLHVAPIQPGTMRDCAEFAKRYQDVDNFEIYGMQNYQLQFISDLFLDKIEWDKDAVNITSIDIEVQSDQGYPEPSLAKFPITAITVRSTRDDVYYCWGLGQYDAKKTTLVNAKIVYVQCNDECDLLEKFLLHWTARYPDIVTGWNSRLFDIVYIVNRITKILGEKIAAKLSPWELIRSSEIMIGTKQFQAYDLVGIQQLDYLDLFKKFGYTYGTPENYKLDTVAFMVLKQKKLDYSEHGSLFTLYRDDHQKFIDYNIRDVQLIDKLEEKTGLINLAMTISYKGLVNMSEAFGPVNMWDSIIYNTLRKRNVVIPPRKEQHKDRQIEGAFVKDPVPSWYYWVCSFDLNSLYPHLMMQYNMSPETVMNKIYPGCSVESLLEEVPLKIEEGTCISATGQYFSKKQRGVIPLLVETMYGERSTFKKAAIDLKKKLEHERDPATKTELERQITRLDTQQLAIKILMNSLYGAMSNEWFRYYDIRVAESITISGQLSIRWALKHLNKYLNNLMNTTNIDYIIAIDTDSMYINFESLVKSKCVGMSSHEIVEYLHVFCRDKIEPVLNDAFVKLKEYLHAYEQKMVMKREAIADKGIWTGKKHYILNVYDLEGVRHSEPELKVVGIEAVRSSTPAVCRKLIVDTLKVIMSSDEKTTQRFIADQRAMFNKCRPEDVAFPRGVSDIEKYVGSLGTGYDKGTPIHVRAAINYNALLKAKNITHKYEPINSGDKIKFLYLKVPNTIRENVIGFMNILPPEFGLEKYVDYDMQWEKAYIEPLRTILDAAKWSVEQRSTLTSFFR